MSLRMTYAITKIQCKYTSKIDKTILPLTRRKTDINVFTSAEEQTDLKSVLSTLSSLQHLYLKANV